VELKGMKGVAFSRDGVNKMAVNNSDDLAVIVFHCRGWGSCMEWMWSSLVPSGYRMPIDFFKLIK
jgi:hypothetical protein